MKKIGIVEILLILIAPWIIGSLFFVTPFYGELNLIDEGQFLAWVNHMMNGKLMYRDIYITYGPLYVYPLYFLFKVFGSSIFLLRVYFIVISTIFSVFVLREVAKKLNFGNLLRLGFIVYVLLIPGLTLRHSMPFLAILLLYLEGKSNKLLHSFLLGIVCALSFLISQEIGIFVIFGSIVYYLFKVIYQQNLDKLLIRVFSWLLGLLVIFIPFALWSSKEGWLFEYIATTIDVINIFSGTDLPNGKSFPNPLNSLHLIKEMGFLRFAISKDLLLYWELLILFSTTLFVFYRTITNRLNDQIFLIFSVNLYGYYLFYSILGRAGNFFLLLSPVFLITFYFMNTLLKERNTKNSLPRKYSIALVLLLVFFLFRVALIFRPYLSHLPNSLSAVLNIQHGLNENVTVMPSEQIKYILGVRQYVVENSSKNEYVFFLSNEPALYYFTNRVNPTKYDLPYIPNTLDKRYQLLDDIRIKKPVLILYNKKSWPVDEISNMQRLPEIMEYLRVNYSKKTILNNEVEVYTLKSR